MQVRRTNCVIKSTSRANKTDCGICGIHNFVIIRDLKMHLPTLILVYDVILYHYNIKLKLPRY